MVDQDRGRAYVEARPWGGGDEQAWVRATYGPGWKPVEFGKTFASFGWGPIHVAMRNVAEKVNPFTGDTQLRTMAIEDCVLPVPLRFPVPLRDAARDPKGFDHHWQKLSYVFHLTDPSMFPRLDLNDDDKETLQRYVYTCRELAGYTAFNEAVAKMDIDKTGPGAYDWSVTTSFPSSESFTGLSARFRQLNNDKEKASFAIARKVIQKNSEELNDPARQEAREMLKAWSRSRAQLNEKMLNTLVCEEAMGPRSENEPQHSYAGTIPSELIESFNYGDTLHWGGKREDLAKLVEDENFENFHKHCVLSSMLALGHLYFGFSILVESALG